MVHWKNVTVVENHDNRKPDIKFPLSCQKVSVRKSDSIKFPFNFYLCTFEHYMQDQI